MEKLGGNFAALASALVWAIASTIYSLISTKASPLILNLSKGLVAIVFIILTICLSHQAIPNPGTQMAAILMLSGILGIGVGDTAYFFALPLIGVRNVLLLQTLSTPITAIFGLIFLGEYFRAISWLGLILTLFGIVIVITERTPHIQQNFSIVGVIWAILSALGNATGAILSRYALHHSDITPLQAVLLRVLAGTSIVSILLLLPRHKQERQLLSNHIIHSPRLLGVIILTALGSTYLGIWLQQIAFKYTTVGIAQTLSATSPLFVLPIVAWLGEVITSRSIIGILITLIGISLLFYS